MPTDSESTIRAHLIISGRVQGVSFRWYTQQQAHRLDLSGWVRNLWDGGVEAVFEGEAQAVRQAISWCHSGPPSAWVESVQVEYEKPTGLHRPFRIVH
jgi:acylphosphatase